MSGHGKTGSAMPEGEEVKRQVKTFFKPQAQGKANVFFLCIG